MTVERRLTVRFWNLRSLRALTVLLAVGGLVFSEPSRAAETVAALSGFAFESASGSPPVVAVVSNTVVAFRAVTGKTAPSGLVPIFAVETGSCIGADSRRAHEADPGRRRQHRLEVPPIGRPDH